MRPLDGITVVALEQVIAGPFATRQLAELGARVIKIERPAGGDTARAYDRTVKGLSSHFVWVNRSKESLALDVKHPAAGEILARLIEKADVFLQNLAPGAAERLGLGPSIRKKYLGLIWCGISGYGPEAKRWSAFSELCCSTPSQNAANSRSFCTLRKTVCPSPARKGP